MNETNGTQFDKVILLPTIGFDMSVDLNLTEPHPRDGLDWTTHLLPTLTSDAVDDSERQ